MIYMDNAATTMRKPKEVAEAVMHAMNSMGNAGRGANEASLSAARVIYDTRELLADFFDAENPKQIVFTSNSTESLNIAIKGILNPKDHAITTMLEHNSVLRPLYEMEERGVELSIVKSDRKGNISYEEIEHEIRQNTKAIICTHGSNLTGNMIDIKRVGEIAKKHGLLFVVDASQTAGVYPIDVQEMHIDILCFTGHKSLLGDIAAALDEAIERLAGDETMLRIHDGSAVINVPLSQVRSITADGHYLNLSTANGPLRWRQSFGRLADMVAPYPQLFACNRGIMVNLAHVDDLTDDGCFLMDDGSKLPVRRSSRAEARSRYFDYLFTHVRR